LIPLEERLGKKLVEPLTAIINETNAMSLLYECIQTCIIGLSTYKVVMRLCVTKLRMFIEHPDQNLKYLGLVALSNIMKVFPRGIIEHRDLILNCLEDEDETIRRRSIELIAGMVDRKNLAFIVDKLKHYLDDATGLYKDELLEKIIDICSQEKYKNITDFEWYLGILLDLSAVKGVKNGNLLRDQILDVCVRVKAVREPAVGMLVDLFEEHALITEAPEIGGACEALFAAAWVVGEYCDHCPDPVRVINSLLNPDNQGLPAHIQAAYLMTITKILTMIGNSENPAAPEDFQTCIGLLDEHLGMFQGSLHIEVQERACFLSHLLQIFKNPEINKAGVLAELKTVQSEVLNPVSAKAGSRVKVPDGLDLDAWIGEPMPEDEEPEMETPSSRWALEDDDEPTGPPQRYAGSGYGGGGNSNRGGGYNDFGNDGPKAYRPPDPEAVKKAAAERAAARVGNRYYLDAGGEDSRTPEEDLGPVRQLEEHVQLSQQEKITFGQTIAKPQRGRRPGPRVQRVKQQVDIIEDDENPDGWVEEKNAKPEEKVVKDALSMVVLDASAEKEALPERKHHVVATKPSPTPTPVKKPEEEPQRRPSQGGTAARGGPGARGGPARGRGGPARGRGGPARGRGGAGARGGATPAASPANPPTPQAPSTPSGSDKRKEEASKPAVVEAPSTPSGSDKSKEEASKPAVVEAPSTPSGSDKRKEEASKPAVVEAPSTPSGSDKSKEEASKPAVVEAPEPPVADIKSPIPETNGEGTL